MDYLRRSVAELGFGLTGATIGPAFGLEVLVAGEGSGAPMMGHLSLWNRDCGIWSAAGQAPSALRVDRGVVHLEVVIQG